MPNESAGAPSGFEDFNFGSLLDPHFTLGTSKVGNKKPKRKIVLPGGGTVQSDEHDLDQDDDMDADMMGEDDDVTAEDIANIVKMTDYIEK